jgi:hypothetical protein
MDQTRVPIVLHRIAVARDVTPDNAFVGHLEEPQTSSTREGQTRRHAGRHFGRDSHAVAIGDTSGAPSGLGELRRWRIDYDKALKTEKPFCLPLTVF